jgi:hypothetical protein
VPKNLHAISFGDAERSIRARRLSARRTKISERNSELETSANLANLHRDQKESNKIAHMAAAREQYLQRIQLYKF